MLKEMNRIYLQTIITCCAWCNKILEVANYENDCEKTVMDNMVIVSHGICESCVEFFEPPDQLSK